MTSTIDLDACFEHVMKLVNQAGEVNILISSMIESNVYPVKLFLLFS